jgi:hypothetical protein
MEFSDIGVFVLILVAWFVASRWVLPWMGVPTCMSCSCGVDRDGPSGNKRVETRGDDR